MNSNIIVNVLIKQNLRLHGLQNDLSTTMAIDSKYKQESIELNRENQELKDALLESNRQYEFLKRTMKYTQMNELKIENQIMNEELSRLRNYIDLNNVQRKEYEKEQELEEENTELKARIAQLQEELSNSKSINDEDVNNIEK